MFNWLGTISFNSGDVNLLDTTFDTDTYPATTLTAITGIVDPHINKPGDGTLAAATLGQRYLLTNDVGIITEWSSLDADKDDIIEYNGSAWIKSFDASATSAVNHLLNNADSKRYKWTGTAWLNAIEGTYKPGYWRIYL